MSRYIFISVLISTTLLFYTPVKAQEKVITLTELFNLTQQNNQQLKVVSAGVDVAKQAVAVSRLQQLPTISTALSLGYLGNARVIENDFSKSRTVNMPHFSNAFGVQASQLIFKGNAVRNSIQVATLQEQLAVLNLEKNTQDVKLLVASNYFDLYRLYNQRKVFTQNILLAKQRLKNIEKAYNQGMITRNDIIRSELQLSNLEMALQVVNNNISILNNRLTTAIGLSETIIIIPDTTVFSRNPATLSETDYLDEALIKNPSIKVAEKNTAIAKKSLDFVRAERAPAISLFVGNNLARPLTTGIPTDKFSFGWQAGITFSYDISSLYKTGKKIRQSSLQVAQLKEVETLNRQNTKLAVNAAFIKYQEAMAQQTTIEKNKLLAEENYRIIEKKYLNQMALFIDMLDAANAKLEADLQNTNAAINTLYTYYILLNSTGNL